MSFSSAGYQLQPVLPELVLAVGSMGLLMLGAYRGQGTTRLVNTLAVCLLVLTGALVKPSLTSIKDLTFRECLTLFPLVALTILFGIYPKPVLDMSAASVQQLVNNYNTAVTAVKAAALLQ